MLAPNFRSLCATFLTAKGFDQNYTVPDIVYTNWFIDTFVALKKLKTGTTNTTSKSRILQQIPSLQLGDTVNFDKSSLYSTEVGQLATEHT